MARVKVFNEVKTSEILAEPQDWDLCLQEVLYVYDEGEPEKGFRFIYRRPNGHLQAARGGARIPSLERAEELIEEAKKRGWGNNVYFEVTKED